MVVGNTLWKYGPSKIIAKISFPFPLDARGQE